MRKIRILNIVISFILLLSLSSCGTLTKSNQKKSYNISDSYFSTTFYEPNTYTKVDLSSGKTTYDYVLTCTSYCYASLYEYTAIVKMYSSSKTLLDTQTINKRESISSQSVFSFDVHVSKDVQSKTKSIDVSFTGKSYEKPSSSPQIYKVTFNYNNETNNSCVEIEKGKTISTPTDPQKTNYIFNGWYTDKYFTNKYDFSEPVTQDLTLYAKYEIDAATITNKISTDLIKGVVKIYNKSYNTFLGFETSSSTSQGSGFCFHIQNGYYYILTNCHVAIKDSSYEKQEFVIEDYQGKTYEGYLFKSADKSTSAISASYDLACLYFKPSSTNVKALSLVHTNPDYNSDIISLGAPKSQSNAITFGVISGYDKFTLTNTLPEESNVTFDVIVHNAFINNGSSGGPLLDANLNVVGVNYAGTSSGIGLAIPAAKVYEFLKTYVYS